MAKKHFQQRFQMLGGKALTVQANTAVAANTAWNVSISSNTSVTRICNGDYPAFVCLDANASSANWDYYMQALSVLDLYNFDSANSVSVAGNDNSTSVYIAQY